MSLIKDLMEYTGESEAVVNTKLKTASEDVMMMWEEHVNKFYRENKFYLYDLTQYNIGNFKERLEEMKEFKGKKVLDFGGGIGTMSIEAAKLGCETHYADMVGSPVWDYAKWRFKKHKTKV